MGSLSYLSMTLDKCHYYNTTHEETHEETHEATHEEIMYVVMKFLMKGFSEYILEGNTFRCLLRVLKYFTEESVEIEQLNEF